ncbi:phosphopantetheine-binding protein [Acidovorax carolinensis]|uniref:Phosphopantetheine-binding protein n=1 Tax=Acidovorax carolinensis TaxID=553814 RepID=A0A240UE25_9BURK|nr:acyl carrier protein [Acidovorax carolinensis]ART54582.1 phosphopantetheine-binding protein [Acidovorax carolinensis]ART59747.1 phosphopantetheine-binding protein [Acidovorax carolinensis]
MTPDIYSTIALLLADKFHIPAEKIPPDAALEDLGLDSLSLMEFVFALEDAFNLRIPEDQLDPRQRGITLTRLQDIVAAHLVAPGSLDAQVGVSADVHAGLAK